MMRIMTKPKRILRTIARKKIPVHLSGIIVVGAITIVVAGVSTVAVKGVILVAIMMRVRGVLRLLQHLMLRMMRSRLRKGLGGRNF
jgi:uncharacterized membrane protein